MKPGPLTALVAGAGAGTAPGVARGVLVLDGGAHALGVGVAGGDAGADEAVDEVEVGVHVGWGEHVGARDRVACALLAGVALGTGGHARVEGCELAHHALVLVLDEGVSGDGGESVQEGGGRHLLVGVHGLGVLAEVVEAGELLAAVAGKGAFPGMLPVRGSGEGQARRGGGTHLTCLARCSLREKTILHSP